MSEAAPPSSDTLPSDGRGAVVTVGTFDGVHRGHMQVLGEIVRRAQQSGRRSVLVTFQPHPLRIVRPEAAPPLLTTPDEKKAMIAQSGLEYAVFLAFNRTLQQYSARRFVEEILLGRLGMQELVIGYDHGFGKDREGTVETMRELGAEHGFSVDVVDAVRSGDDAISSTRIRRALAAGDVITAARALGRPYSLEGTVVRGDGRGRHLGFPTANIEIGDREKMLPLEGIYAVHGWVRGQRIPGLLHLGPRPAFPGASSTIETYLLDWKGDIYGEQLRLELCARIREIQPFTSVDGLVEQIRQDEIVGRAMLAGTQGPTACQKPREPLE